MGNKGKKKGKPAKAVDRAPKNKKSSKKFWLLAVVAAGCAGVCWEVPGARNAVRNGVDCTCEWVDEQQAKDEKPVDIDATLDVTVE